MDENSCVKTTRLLFQVINNLILRYELRLYTRNPPYASASKYLLAHSIERQGTVSRCHLPSRASRRKIFKAHNRISSDTIDRRNEILMRCTRNGAYIVVKKLKKTRNTFYFLIRRKVNAYESHRFTVIQRCKVASYNARLKIVNESLRHI